MISNTSSDGIRAQSGSLALNNSTLINIGDGDASDDALHLTNNAVLSGSNNSIEGVINSGQACRTDGSTTGSIGFSSGPIVTCP